MIKGLTVRGKQGREGGGGDLPGKAFEVFAGYSCFQHFFLLMGCWRHKKRIEEGEVSAVLLGGFESSLRGKVR